MKKLLGIVVLGLLLNGCGDSAEKIVLDCKGVSATFDGKADVNDFDRTIIIDLNKKTWRNPGTKKEKLVIQDSFFGKYYIAGYVVGVANPGIGVLIHKLNRYNGDLNVISTDLPVSVGEKMQKMNKSKSNLETFNKLYSVALQEYMKSKDGWFSISKCSKSKKAF